MDAFDRVLMLVMAFAMWLVIFFWLIAMNGDSRIEHEATMQRLTHIEAQLDSIQSTVNDPPWWR